MPVGTFWPSVAADDLVLIVSRATRKKASAPLSIFVPPLDIRFLYTTLSGEDLAFSTDRRSASGEGQWKASDTFFTAHGIRLDANGEEGRLSAEQVDFLAGSYSGTIGRVALSKSGSYLSDMNLNMNLGRFALIGIRARRVNLDKSGKSVAEGVGISALGVHLLSLAKLPVGLKTTSSGAEIPDADLVPEQLGIDKDSGPNFASRWDFGGGIGISLDEPLSFDIRVGYSLIDSFVPLGPSLDEPDLKGSYASSLYSNIRKRTLDDYTPKYSASRLCLFTLVSRNQRYLDADGTTEASRPFVFGLEFGGKIADAGYRLQVRRERIETAEGKASRNALLGSLGIINRPFASGWRVDSRIDGMAIDQGGPVYAWARPTLGLTARVVPNVSLSGAMYYAFQTGNHAEFPFDAIIPGAEVHLRADFRVGNVILGLLTRHSTELGSFYRSQYYVEFPVGPIQTWYKYDTQTGNVAFGLSVRTDSLANLFQRRKFVSADPLSR